jgi:hypothetical protein
MKTITEEVELLFRHINKDKGWMKPKIKTQESLWRPPRRGKIKKWRTTQKSIPSM